MGVFYILIYFNLKTFFIYQNICFTNFFIILKFKKQDYLNNVTKLFIVDRIAVLFRPRIKLLLIE